MFMMVMLLSTTYSLKYPYFSGVNMFNNQGIQICKIKEGLLTKICSFYSPLLLNIGSQLTKHQLLPMF